MSDYSNEWQVEIIFEPTGDYMNFTYETDEDEEDRVVLQIMNQISVVADKVK